MLVIHSFNTKEILSPQKSDFYFGADRSDSGDNHSNNQIDLVENLLDTDNNQDNNDSTEINITSIKQLMQLDKSVRIDRITSASNMQHKAVEFTCTERNKNRLNIPISFTKPVAEEKTRTSIDEYVDNITNLFYVDRGTLDKVNKADVTDTETSELLFNQNITTGAVSLCGFDVKRFIPNRYPVGSNPFSRNFVCISASFWDDVYKNYPRILVDNTLTGKKWKGYSEDIKRNQEKNYNNFLDNFKESLEEKFTDVTFIDPREVEESYTDSYTDSVEYKDSSGEYKDSYEQFEEKALIFNQPENPQENDELIDLDSSIEVLLSFHEDMFYSTFHNYMRAAYLMSKRVDIMHEDGEWDYSFECPEGKEVFPLDYAGFCDAISESIECGESELYFVTREISDLDSASMEADFNPLLLDNELPLLDEFSEVSGLKSAREIIKEFDNEILTNFISEVNHREVIGFMLVNKINNKHSVICNPAKYLVIESVYVNEKYRKLGIFEMLINVVKNNTDLHVNNTDGIIQYPGFIINVSPQNTKMVSALEKCFEVRQRRIEYVFEP